MAEKTLFLLDAMALIYRAHFAFIRSPRINSKGMNTSAVFGFTNSLIDLMKREEPSHIGIVYDTDTPTFRHEQFTAYKANRQKKPEDISIAQPYIIRMAEGFGIPNLMLDGFEADDVIGTLACKAAEQGYKVYMVTPDKDFGQLVTDYIYMYKPSYQNNPVEVLGPKEIMNRWGISDPRQVKDILGLMGDSSDNIPGVPGVGEKSAAKIIQEWGSIENALANADKIKGKVGDLLRENAELARQSKHLATIICDAPIEFDEHALELSEPDYPLLRQLFEELEFRTLFKRIFADEEAKEALKSAPENAQIDLFSGPTPFTKGVVLEPEAPSGPIAEFDRDKVKYQLITTTEEAKKLADKLKTLKVFAVDTETSNTDPMLADIVGFSIATKPGEAYYIATNGDEEDDADCLYLFKEVFESDKIEKVGQNIKYDMIVLRNHGVDLKPPFFDTLLAHYLIEPEQRHGLDLLSERYLNYKPIPIEALIGKGRKQKNMRELSPEEIRDYACEDADVTLQLKEKLSPELDEVKARKLFEEVEVPLMSVLADVEREGVNVDADFLKDYSKTLASDIKQLEGEIYELAGTEFNIGSPLQLGEILFDRLKLDPNAKRTTKSKQYATGEEVLIKLADRHDIVQKILDHRSLQKLKSTYVDALPNMINPRTGRLHTSYNQAVAATGRLSSSDPNLQNIPIRTERGREIRKAFIPKDEEHVILSADYSQIELRLVAEMSGEEAMIQAFKQGHDIHTATAARVYHVPVEEVTPEMRRRAKTTNFGIIYGISAFGLAQRLNISRAEAGDIIREYRAAYPGIEAYMQRNIEFARDKGYVETLLGRRRYLRDINSGNATQRGFAERNAINAPIQGTAADMIKIAMIHIHDALKEADLKTSMILQVHDELVFDARKDELAKVKEIVEDKMKKALPLRVPIEVEMGVGENWLEAH